MLWLCTVARSDDFIINFIVLVSFKAPAPEIIWKEQISALSSVSGNKTNNKKKHIGVGFFSLALSPTENLKMPCLTLPKAEETQLPTFKMWCFLKLAIRKMRREAESQVFNN